MKLEKITKNFITAYKKSKYRRISVENERLKKSISNPNTILLPKSVFLAITKNLPDANSHYLENFLPEGGIKVENSYFSINFVKKFSFDYVKNFKILIDVYFNERVVSTLEIYCINKTFIFSNNIQIRSYYWDFSSLKFEIISDESWFIMNSAIEAFISITKNNF